MFSVKLIVVCFLNIISLVIFLYGFFPLQSKISTAQASPEDNSGSFYGDPRNGSCEELDAWRESRTQSPKRAVDNIVLIIIDALRYDFIFTPMNRPNGRMRFLKDLIDSGHAFGYEATVQPPTVTMPRIKAITAGMVPAFADVVLNFASSAFTDDNLITASKNAGRRILFYGDDTWLRLFPDHFQDSEGVSSFIVTDYTEVDGNVTRHLPKVINSAEEWDLAILHYIGLDHIGHTSGPHSPLLSRKLAEMDDVIKTLYFGFKEKAKSVSIIVLGDHGMTDVGSHGGASHHETTVPMLFVSSVESGQSVEGPDSAQKAQQVDLTPTLAALLGLSIPINSVGIVLSSAIKKYHIGANPFTSANELDLFRRNAVQMLELYQRNAANRDWSEAFNQYTRLSDDYHVWLETEFCRKPHERSSTLLEHSRFAEMLKDRYRRLMEEMREQVIASSISYNESALIIGIMAFVAALLQSARTCQNVVIRDFFNGNGSGRRCQFLLIGCLLHSVGFASSSFIEEEHFTWYFLFSTYLFILLLGGVAVRHRHKAVGTSIPLGQILLFYCGPILLFRLVRVWNHAGIKWRDSDCFTDWLLRSDSRGLKLSFVVYGVGLIGIFIAALEQSRGGFQKLLLMVSYTLVVMYRTELSAYWSVVTARTVYVLSAVFVLLRRPMISAMLLTSLLVKVTNLPLVLFTLLIQRLVVVAAAHASGSPLEFTCSNYYLAMASYFALGNSNSLGHIDVSSGYVGFSAYSPVINGLLIAAHLYAGPLLVSTSAMTNNAVSIKDSSKDEWGFVILTLKGVPTAFYLLIAYLQRYHLFVWSVFAPKLLYECAHMAVICVSMLLVQFFTTLLALLGRSVPFG